MKKSILYVINHMDWFWSHRLPLAKGAKNAGWDVRVACAGAARDEKLHRYRFTGLDLPKPDGPFAPATMVKTIVALRKIIKEQKPDLIHAITLKYAFIAGLAALGNKDVRIVHTIAGLGYLFSGEGLKPRMLRFLAGPFLKLALRRPNTTLIIQNPDDREILISRGFAHEEKAVLIRGSGVDITSFRHSTEPNTAEPIILMPTRLVHDKGVAIFVEAARILKSRKIQARFQIAGGETRHNPQAISADDMRKMIADGVAEWLGRVEDMQSLYARSTLIVYPSWYREGVPKVLLEAAATGRTIVTTDHPGCREAVSHNDNGLLVPVKNATATADAIQYLLDHADERQRMATRGRERAEQEFDVRRIVEETLKVYT